MNPYKAFQVARLPEIRFGSGTFDDIPDVLAGYGREVLLVTGRRSLQDTPRWQHLIDALAAGGIRWRQVTVDGEPSPELVDDAVRKHHGIDIDVVVGIGGGIVCDICGFVASTFLRGVRFGFVATTLLAQVDASVGGKNGVNFGGYKNMVGTFNQPEFVLCDLDLLRSLPEEQLQCGFAEIVKHAAIADAGMFEALEKDAERALALDPMVIEGLVYDSLVIKSTIVNQDEKETGERRKLNFGHTFGHAIEKVTGVPHGQAVSAGMVLAAGLSHQRGLITASEKDRLCALLEQLNLPTGMTFDQDAVLLADDLSQPTEELRPVTLQIPRLGLEPGKLADMVILESDPRDVDPVAISDIKVSETWMDGKQVFEA